MQIDVMATATRKIIDFRKAGFERLVVLGKYNYIKVEKKLPEHIHEDMVEICYCNKGSQWFTVNGNPYLVRGGDVFIHFPGELHGSGEYPEDKGSLYWLIVRHDSEPDARNKAIPEALSYLCDQLITRHKRHFRGNNRIQRLLEDIFIAYAQKRDKVIRHIRINLLVQAFLLELLDCINNGKDNTDNDRLKKIFQYIDANITQPISIATLAAELCLSESRFKSLFKELTGFTPGDYIQRRRIECALERMDNEPGITASQLAYELNFSSPQYFSTVMKKYTGRSPVTHRRTRGK